MNQSPSASVPYIVLGAFLAVITSLIVEIVRHWIGTSRGKRVFKTFLGFEIPEMCAVMDRLIEDFNRQRFMPFTRLTELESARQGFDRNRDWIIAFKDNTIRRDIFDFFRDVSRYLADARGVENFAVSPVYLANVAVHLPNVTNERQQIISQFGRLAARGRTLAPARLHELR